MNDEIDSPAPGPAMADVVRALIEVEAERQGFHCPEDAWLAMPPNANVTTPEDIARAVAQVAEAHPALNAPLEPTPPPVGSTLAPGHVTRGGRGWPKKPLSGTEQWLQILKQGRR